MYAVAKEEVYFKRKHNEEKAANTKRGLLDFVNYDGDGYYAKLTDLESTNIVRSILTLTSFESKERARLSKVVEIQYPLHASNVPRETYTVGDLEDNKVTIQTTQNRSVFALISYLYAQLAIDPQKLPVQQLIQVR
jgi:hypothetical protein